MDEVRTLNSRREVRLKVVRKWTPEEEDFLFEQLVAYSQVNHSHKNRYQYLSKQMRDKFKRSFSESSVRHKVIQLQDKRDVRQVLEPIIFNKSTDHHESTYIAMTPDGQCVQILPKAVKATYEEQLRSCSSSQPESFPVAFCSPKVDAQILEKLTLLVNQSVLLLQKLDLIYNELKAQHIRSL